ncbi:MAG: class I SAM-dependent methyltransferase [Candidatus Omnitrophota bacterium]
MDSPKRDFDKEAAFWDTPPRMKLASDVACAISAKLVLTPDMDVLDFGCGTGLVTLPIARQVKSVTGVDSSRGMLDVLEEKTRQQKTGHITILHADLSQGGVLNGPYHALISSMTLHHIKDTSGILKCFHQAILKDGYIALADLDTEDGGFHENNDGVFHFGFDRAALGRLITQAGFTDVCFTTAAQMHKPGPQGQERVFGVFLVTARKL